MSIWARLAEGFSFTMRAGCSILSWIPEYKKTNVRKRVCRVYARGREAIVDLPERALGRKTVCGCAKSVQKTISFAEQKNRA